MKKKTYKAAALMSGGLDSLLAAKVIADQGVHVEGLFFAIGFAGDGSKAKLAAEKIGIKLHVFDAVEEFRRILLNPKHGYGAHLNPCLDCKIFMVKKAKRWIEQHGFDFIVTGEVIGQRPKSQLSKTLSMVALESAAGDILLRPLCAKNLPITKPEKKGWVNRDLLFGFSGRSRKPQIKLAKKLGFADYPQPAGGCLLTDKKYCDRLHDLWAYRGNKDFNKDDLELLKVGRHIRPKANFKIIIGRNETENDVLQHYFGKFFHFFTVSHGGSVALLDGDFGSVDIKLAARIIARFSSGRDAEQVTLQAESADGISDMLKVKPMPANEILQGWYI